MDLWIRSQDKMNLRPNPKLAIEIVEESYYITDRYDFDKSDILGIYKTEKRALEVLDEIQNYLINNQYGKKVNGLGKEIDLIPNYIFVYQMPIK